MQLTAAQLIFHLLNGKLFSPTATATYNDINFGISSFMTCIEAVIFSLIFQWSFSSGEFKEGKRLDRLGMQPAQRTKTLKAIFDALNLSDIVNGTIVAFELFFGRVKSRYGAARMPQRQQAPRGEDEVHLEPLAGRPNVRGYEYDMPQAPGQSQGQYEGGYGSPPMPKMERRDSYPRRGYGNGGDSPENQPLQYGRQML